MVGTEVHLTDIFPVNKGVNPKPHTTVWEALEGRVQAST
jgi:hypothetical protein